MTKLLLIENIELFGILLNNIIGFTCNLLIGILCFVFYSKLKPIQQGNFSWWWRLFFLLFGISSILRALGQLFYEYTGSKGMIPMVIFAFIANLLAARAMLTFKAKNRTKNILILIIFLKFCILLFFALYTGKYMFEYLDAIITCVGCVFIIGIIQFIRSKQTYWLLTFLSVVPMFPTILFNVSFLEIYHPNGQLIEGVLTIVSLILLFIANIGFTRRA